MCIGRDILSKNYLVYREININKIRVHRPVLSVYFLCQNISIFLSIKFLQTYRFPDIFFKLIVFEISYVGAFVLCFLIFLIFPNETLSGDFNVIKFKLYIFI